MRRSAISGRARSIASNVLPSITSSRAALRTTAVAERGRPFRIAISPKNSPSPSTASTRSGPPTRRRISISPATTTYITSPG